MKIIAIILAAGQGKRMNAPVAKQFLMLHHKPIIYYSLKAFEESCIDEVILVTGEGQADYCKQEIVDRYQFRKVKKIIQGGKERYDSVYQALCHTEKADYVLIHDGARPFITKELIEITAQQVVADKACIVGVQVKETIKVVNQEGYIISTPNRNMLWTAQTPQAFEYSSIQHAYDCFCQDSNKAGLAITDDAMVYETYIKKPVTMISGDYRNIKITTPEDLILAEEIIKHILCE